MSMIPLLIHYTSSPLDLLQDIPAQSTGFKPKGLWVSVGSAWKDWCHESEFALDRFERAYEIELHDDSGVLVIRNDEEFLEFRKLYEVAHRQYAYMVSVDWARVAGHYSGILFTTYYWMYRLDVLWYYRWDVASGCIWQPSRAVKAVREVVQVQQEAACQ